ncbi:MAG: carbohydrate-binding family 9-like protein [Victivallales bacterium]|nr:carbohydrate-binding family 9-like protein [Victivallales bacterium]
MQSAPEIDGRLEKGEWARAAAVTGFQEQGDCKLSPQQSVVYISYDEQNLYFALRSVVTGPFKKGEAGRDKIKMDCEAFEIWVSPKERQWFQFLGVPAGGFMDISSEAGIKWNGDIKYSSRFDDAGENAGGILTFNKTLWTAEIAMPLKSIGITSPPPQGTIWRMNFCRDLAEVDGKSRTIEQWTSWSPTQNHFTDTSFFGYVEFGGDCPAVQLLGLGEPRDGLLHLNGEISLKSLENVKLASIVKIKDTEKVVLEKETSVSTSEGKSFSLESLLKLSRTTDLVLEFTASNPSGSQKYYIAKIPFACVSSFDVKVIPVYTKGFADIELDTARVEEIGQNDKVSVNIEGTDISAEKIIVSPGGKIQFRFDISKLSAGDYVVKSSVLNGNNQIIVSSSVPLTIPQKPQWLGNAIGISEQVPPPWGPMETNGNIIAITGRKYALADNGLPEQIVVCNERVFTKRPSINLVVAGKSKDIVFEPVKNTSANETESAWLIKGAFDNLKIEGSLCTEYDGFSLYKFTISPLAPIEIDAIYMDFPIGKNIANYVRANAYLPKFKNCNASLYKGFSSAKRVDLAGKWFYSPGWCWPGEFFNEIWVGNDRVGFALMTESDENIRGNKHIEFLDKDDDTTILRVNLVSKRMMLDRPMKYEYAWTATPVKPETKNPKKWHASYFANWPEDFSKRLYVGAQYRICSPSYPKLRNPVNNLVAKNHEYGAKVVPDFYLCAAQLNTREQKLFGHEWEVTPRQSWSNMVFASPNSNYTDFLLHTVKCYVENFGLDGVYLDVSLPVASDNPYHDAGYTDRNGKRCPTATIWKLRNLYKRLYTYLHTEGRDGVIFAHAATLPEFVGFVDVLTAGEEWGAEKEKLYSRLSPDMFRTKEMHIQYGVPYTFYSFHQYSWRVNDPVPLDEILMMTLPHRIMPTIGDAAGGKAIIPVWDLMDEWITSSDFIPYWSPKSPVRTNSESVLASIYNKKNERKALMIVSNWGYAPAEAKISLTFAHEKTEKLKMTEIYPENTTIQLHGNSASFSIKARGFKIIRVDY